MKTSKRKSDDSLGNALDLMKPTNIVTLVVIDGSGRGGVPLCDAGHTLQWKWNIQVAVVQRAIRLRSCTGFAQDCDRGVPNHDTQASGVKDERKEHVMDYAERVANFHRATLPEFYVVDHPPCHKSCGKFDAPQVTLGTHAGVAGSRENVALVRNKAREAALVGYDAC